MSQADIIQVEYETLADIAARFGKAARTHETDAARINRALWAVMDSWKGQAATSFAWEVSGELLPGFSRLVSALDEAERITLEIARTFREAEETAAGLFPVEPTMGPALPPGWEPASQPVQESNSHIVRWLKEIYERPEIFVKYIEELTGHYSDDAARLRRMAEDFVTLWRRNPIVAIKFTTEIGRRLPKLGDYFTIATGVTDIATTLEQNRDEYASYDLPRAVAAIGVDVVVASTPAVTELVAGWAGGLAVGGAGFVFGQLAGGAVGFIVGGPPGAAAGSQSGV